MDRTNSKDSQNPNFFVGCFELIIRKNFAKASKMGRNGQKLFIFAIFLWNPFLRGVLDQKLFFLRLFLAFWGLGLIHFVAMCTLDSGIAVHSYTGIQMLISWTLGLQSIAQMSTNTQHINSCNPISMSRTSPLICFGAHQQPHPNIPNQPLYHYLNNCDNPGCQDPRFITL